MKFHFIFFSFCILLPFILSSCFEEPTLPSVTQITPQKLVEIPHDLNEISGITFRNDTSLFAHNDGGQGAYIFHVNLKEERIDKKTKIFNATNFDWEDMTQDEEYIYISDSGNSLGQRTDLKIYKIKKNEIESLDSVAAEIIEFEYPDKVDFPPTKDHNYECEAIISYEDKLFLFSKNHLDQKTRWYSLPKNPGNYEATLIRGFESNGLITGATISEDKNVIALLGYQENGVEFEPFIWLLYNFPDGKIFDGRSKRLEFTFNEQMEAICFGKNRVLYFSHESESGDFPQHIYEIDIQSYLN